MRRAGRSRIDLTQWVALGARELRHILGRLDPDSVSREALPETEDQRV